MKRILGTLLLAGLTLSASQARPNMSPEDMEKAGKDVKAQSPTPTKMPAPAVVGSIKEADWKPTHLEVAKATGYWTAGNQKGILEAKLPRSLWGKGFTLQIVGSLRTGSVHGFFVSPEGMAISDVISRNAGTGSGPPMALNAEVHFFCPAKGAILRFEVMTGGAIKLESAKYTL